MLKENKWKVLLFFILYVNALICLYGIGNPSFKADELLYAWDSEKLAKNPNYFFSEEFWRYHPPLVRLIAVLPSLFFNSLVSTRLVSITAGLITIVGVFLIAKQISNNKIASISAFLVAFNPLFISIQKHSSVDSLPIAGLVLVTYFLIKEHYYLSFFAALIAAFSKTSGITALAIFWIYSTLNKSFRKQKTKSYALFTLIFFALSLAVLVFYVAQPDIDALAEATHFLGLMVYRFLISFWILPFSVIGFYCYRKKPFFGVFVLWVLLSLWVVIYPYDIRYYMPLFPVLTIFGVLGFREIAKKINQPTVLFIPVVVCLVWLAAVPQSLDGGVKGYEMLAEWSLKNLKEGDVIFLRDDRALRYFSKLEFFEDNGPIKSLPRNKNKFTKELESRFNGTVYVVREGVYAYQVPWLDQKFLGARGFKKKESFFYFEIYSRCCNA